MPEQTTKRPNLPTTIASIAIIISFIALVVASWQASETQKHYRWLVSETEKHNRLTVKPNLVYRWESSGDWKYGKLAIVNAGPGTALIKEYKLFLDREEVGTWKGDFFNTLHKKIGIPGNVEPNWTTFVTTALKPGDEILLYEYKTDKPVDEQLVHDLNNRLDVEIYSCSIYDECLWKKY